MDEKRLEHYRAVLLEQLRQLPQLKERLAAAL